MSEIILCPSCQRKLSLTESLLGQDVQCPTCGATFTAKGQSSPEASPPSSQTAQPPRLPSEAPPYEDDRDRPRRRIPDYDDDYPEDDYDHRRRRRDLVPHRAATILTLGIISIFILGFILGPIAWVMGSTDLKEIRAGRMDPEGEGSTRAGLICGIIGTILHILSFCLCVGLFARAFQRPGF